jgi:hypothetical protein
MVYQYTDVEINIYSQRSSYVLSHPRCSRRSTHFALDLSLYTATAKDHQPPFCRMSITHLYRMDRASLAIRDDNGQFVSQRAKVLIYSSHYIHHYPPFAFQLTNRHHHCQQ